MENEETKEMKPRVKKQQTVDSIPAEITKQEVPVARKKIPLLIVPPKKREASDKPQSINRNMRVGEIMINRIRK